MSCVCTVTVGVDPQLFSWPPNRLSDYVLGLSHIQHTAENKRFTSQFATDSNRHFHMLPISNKLHDKCNLLIIAVMKQASHSHLVFSGNITQHGNTTRARNSKTTANVIRVCTAMNHAAEHIQWQRLVTSAGTISTHNTLHGLHCTAHLQLTHQP